MNTLPVLNWISHHDPRSRSYPIRTLVRDIKIKTRVWTPGEILDQKKEGLVSDMDGQQRLSVHR